MSVLFCSGCDLVYKAIDQSGAEEKELLGELLPFDAHPTVAKVQRYLKVTGYYQGKVDGVLGPGTRKSLQKFQTDLSFDATGFIDQQTFSHLAWIDQQNFLIEDQLNMMLIRQLLQQKGYQVGTIDGQFGPKTKKALISFQQDLDLPQQEGKIDYFTLIFLVE